MAGDPADFAPLRFSTGALPVRERLPFWREVFGRKFCHLDIEPWSDEPLEAEVSLRTLPGLRTMSCVISPTRQQRTPEMVAEGDDSLALPMNLSGTVTFAQRGREASLGAGDAVLVLHAEPATMINSHTRSTNLLVPRAALAPLISNIEDAAMRVIPRDNEALRLLASYLGTMRDEPMPAAPALRHLMVTHVYDLMAMAIGATRDGAAVAAERGVRAARLAAIMDDIRARLGDHSLTLPAVAARARVTPRYVQRLFESEGVTFSEFVLGERLASAHRMLGDPRHAGSTISAIALVAGFGDVSYFNRAFRRCYGATPSDVRAGSARDRRMG